MPLDSWRSVAPPSPATKAVAGTGSSRVAASFGAACAATRRLRLHARRTRPSPGAHAQIRSPGTNRASPPGAPSPAAAAATTSHLTSPATTRCMGSCCSFSRESISCSPASMVTSAAPHARCATAAGASWLPSALAMSAASTSPRSSRHAESSRAMARGRVDARNASRESHDKRHLAEAVARGIGAHGAPARLLHEDIKQPRLDEEHRVRHLTLPCHHSSRAVAFTAHSAADAQQRLARSGEEERMARESVEHGGRRRRAAAVPDSGGPARCSAFNALRARATSRMVPQRARAALGLAVHRCAPAGHTQTAPLGAPSCVIGGCGAPPLRPALRATAAAAAAATPAAAAHHFQVIRTNGKPAQHRLCPLAVVGAHLGPTERERELGLGRLDHKRGRLAVVQHLRLREPGRAADARASEQRRKWLQVVAPTLRGQPARRWRAGRGGLVGHGRWQRQHSLRRRATVSQLGAARVEEPAKDRGPGLGGGHAGCRPRLLERAPRPPLLLPLSREGIDFSLQMVKERLERSGLSLCKGGGVVGGGELG
eukprot:scaffold27631_cov24-Tisochrysis_lutea.AAC.1